MTATLALIHDGACRDVPAHWDGDTVRLAAADFESAVGWELKPQGLCRGDVCIPTRRHPDLATDAGIDLAAASELLGLPLAVDRERSAASLGASAGERASALASGVAPDFTLPDLTGKEHSLSAHRGKKVLLVAYASW